MMRRNKKKSKLNKSNGVVSSRSHSQDGVGKKAGQGDCESRASVFRQARQFNTQSEFSQESHDLATIDHLLREAQSYISPCFMMSFKDMSPDQESNIYPACPSKAEIERKRDKVVLEILIKAAKLDNKYHKVASNEEIFGLYVGGDEDVISLSQQDIVSADAITLVRQNQALLCNFLIKRAQRDSEGGQLHEILMWCLLFLLHSATKLSCAPEHVVDLILSFAESLNLQLKSFYFHEKKKNAHENHVKMHEVQRHWILLQRLVCASSGSNETSVLSINVRNGFRFSNLVPPLAWMQKAPVFSSSRLPLVRYFGWMAVARNAKQFLKEQRFLVSDFSQLTQLLSIFSDDLSLVDNIIKQKGVDKDIFIDHQDELQSFHAHPDISKFFPNIENEFDIFGETILEAVCLHLKFLSSSVVPDILSWFSDLCSRPFVQNQNAQVSFQHKSDYYKGFVAKNAKAVIVYILEAIVVEHMEAMVPKIRGVVQVLVSLCKTSYCDVSFLDSTLCLLKPIIEYSLKNVSDEENSLADNSCDNFESSCFVELFTNIKYVVDSRVPPIDKGKCQATTIYVLATFLGDLSFHQKIELLYSTTFWVEFASFEGLIFFPDVLYAYQILLENCRDLLISTSRAWGIVPLQSSSHSLDDNPYTSAKCEAANAGQKTRLLKVEEIKSFSKYLEALISKVNPILEQFCRVHHVLSKNLVLTSAECNLYARCLCLNTEKVSARFGDENLVPAEFSDKFTESWRASLPALSKMILMLQEKHCWKVASVLLDSLLEVPQCFQLDNVIDDICAALKNFFTRAPIINWRLQTDRMISLLLSRGIHNICKSVFPLVDLFCALLGHREAEQRYIALKHLGRLVGQDVNGGRLFLSSTTESMIALSDFIVSCFEWSPFFSAIWDNVALVASSDSSLLLRSHATDLLINLIPFVEKSKLQAFLAAANNVLQCPLTQFSLELIASVCLHSPPEDLSLIPDCFWRNIETFGMSRTDTCCTSLEKRICEALCRVKNDREKAKELLKGVLSSSLKKQQFPDFETTRESIIQIIGRPSARLYLDFYSKEEDRKIMVLDEAEIEMDLLQREAPLLGASFDFQDWQKLPLLSTYAKQDHPLQQIIDGMRSIERANEEEMEHDGEQLLEREQANEEEKELDGQQLLEREQAKTREFWPNIDIEKEKQARAREKQEISSSNLSKSNLGSAYRDNLFFPPKITIIISSIIIIINIIITIIEK